MSKQPSKPDRPLDAAAASLRSLRPALDAAPGYAGCHTFLWRPGGRSSIDRWRRLRFADGLATDFRAGITESLRDQLPTVKELVVFGYDDPAASQTVVLAKTEYPDIAKWFDEAPGPDWTHLFGGEKSFLDKVKMHVTSIDLAGDGKVLKVFRQRTATTLLKQRGMFALLKKAKNEFIEIKEEVYDFPLGADFIEWEGFVFIFRLGSFESLTNVREVTSKRAAEAIEVVKNIEKLSVPNIQNLMEGLKSKVQLTRKLAAASRLGILNALRADALADRIDELDLSLRVERGRRGAVTVHVDPDNAVEVTDFIEVVTDVYLLSPMTQLTYKVGYKELASSRPRKT